MKIEVRDLKNPDRLLGYMNNPPSIHGPLVRYAILPRIPSVVPYDSTPTPVEAKSITLQTDWFAEDSGWTRRKKFVTDVPLEDLLRLHLFTLPGESLREAAERRRFS